MRATTVFALLSLGCVSCSSASEQTADAGGGDASTGHLDAGRPDAGPAPVDAGPGVDAGSPTPDAGSDAGCGPVSCTTNPGAPCRLGVRMGPSCIDDANAPDATACTGGACVAGVCGMTRTVSVDTNLTTDHLDPARTCADAPEYSVTALSAATATLATAPATGCLVAGDEVMLINLQGTPTANGNVGNWELLRVASSSAMSVTFRSAPTRFYGEPAATNAGLGVDAMTQRVMLVRVPAYGSLHVAAGAKLTANAWDGALGGVLALRAGTLTVDGTLDASRLGYRAGRWSQDVAACSTSLATEAGESISGRGMPSSAANLGGAGGLAAGSGSFIGASPLCATPGHAHAGEAGIANAGRTVGEPGAAYGANDASRLTMGSGPGGNVTCTTEVSAPRLIDLNDTAAGIIAIFGGTITVGTGGSITASPGTVDRDTAFAGGYVYLEGSTLSLGSGLVQALGGPGVSGSAPSIGSNRASDGYVVLRGTTITGTTTPAAHAL